MDESIRTSRLVLHPLQSADAAEMVSVLGAPSLYAFTGGEAPTRQVLEERYRSQVAGSGDPDELWWNWIIRTADDERAVGFVQATVIGRCAELAWTVGAEEQGKGFASEAALAMRNHLANEGAVCFEAFIHPDHAASQAVARHAGLRRTSETDDEGEELWSSAG